ncbi:MAG: hypothetical protein K2J80_07920 [Oscillospiraceae bacterium]|nr:hypothetical protein [Oscillospiraceae bacterium]
MDPNVINNVLVGQEKTDIEGYVARLQTEVESVAQMVYSINNFANATQRKFKQWYDAAVAFLNTGNGVHFIEANYGYAVEEYVNLKILGGSPALPSGYTAHLQVTYGNTRPDITISNRSGKEIAWLDITNQGSTGHVHDKDGNWQNGRDYIAELLYPDFDASKITTGGSGIAAHAAVNSVIRRAHERERALKRHLVSKMNNVLSDLTGRIAHGERIYMADVANSIARHFSAQFKSSYKHPIIKSLLQIYLECYDEGGYDVLYAGDADECMRVLYNQTGQCKSKAMTFIEESFENSSVYTSYF